MFHRTGLPAIIASVAIASVATQEPHSPQLPKGVELMLLGSYELDKPTSTGAREIHVSIVDDQPRLRIGEDERRLIFEGAAREETGGVITDVYRFTVVGRPGVQTSFKIPRGRGSVDYLTYFEEFAKPEVFASGKPKQR